MLYTTDIGPGEEQYEEYRSATLRRKMVQYDYRDETGELFSCVAPSLEDARKRRDNWLTIH